MNSLVQVRMNSTGLASAPRATRVQAAHQTSANYVVRAKDLIAKAGATGTEETGTREVKQELDKDAFLRLMILQMQNQDPMSPMDNTAMIAQLAQFSSLEQMNNLNASFTALGGTMEQLNFIAANQFLGRTISGVDINGKLQEGKVDRVVMDSGTVYLLLGVNAVPVANILAVKETSSSKK